MNTAQPEVKIRSRLLTVIGLVSFTMTVTRKGITEMEYIILHKHIPTVAAVPEIGVD